MSSVEAEKYITDAGRVENQSADGRIVGKATRYLRMSERRQRQKELRRLEATLAPQNVRDTGLGEDSIRDAAKHRALYQRDLRENSPPDDLSGETRNAIYNESKRLEAEIREGMLSRQEMRYNRPGAVDHHIKWERSKKPAILKWKNLQVLLNPDSDEQDLANIERLRPEGNIQTVDTSAQIVPHFTLPRNTPEEIAPAVTEGSPMAAAERRELEELRAQVAALQAKKAAASDRMAKARAAKGK
jgi:hypothetical protein